MKLFKWAGSYDVILFAFSSNTFAGDNWYKIIWGDKTSGGWDVGKLSESSFVLYDPIDNHLKLQSEVYRSLIEFIWNKKFSDFLTKKM